MPMFADQRANINEEIISLCYTRYEPIILPIPLQYPVNELSYYCVVRDSSLYQRASFTCFCFDVLV